MADVNGIIFKNPTLNTWFVAPTVDLTAWNVITVSGCTDAAFNLDYTYNVATAKWENGLYKIWKDTVWKFTDGVTVVETADNGLNIPPVSLNLPFRYPLTITVVGAFAGVYSYEFFAYWNANTWVLDGKEIAQLNGASTTWRFQQRNRWAGEGDPVEVDIYYSKDGLSSDYPDKTGWDVVEGTEPAPTLEYTLEAPATVSSSSTARWVSNNPTTGFVSLTDTPDEDFGYVITFDVHGGASYPYYKYCTKAAGEVYGTLPEATRANYIFAGWYTDPDGQGTRILATTELVEAADHTLYAKWVSYVSGKVGCGACLVSLFTLGIGTDIFCEYIGSRLAKTTPQTIVRKLPKA